MSELEPPPLQNAPPIQPPAVSAPQELVPLPGIPFPPLAKALAALTAVAFLFALFRMPGAIANGVRNQRGSEALAAGRFKEASEQLGPLVEAYPGAEEARISLIRADLGAGDLEGAVHNLGWFQGKEVTDTQARELTDLESEIASRLDKVKQ